jgi:hypothetical protein
MVVVHIKVTGRLINLMVKVIIKIAVWNIKVDGRRINYMGMEWPYGKMEDLMKGIM